MYSDISRNKRDSVILVSLFAGIILALGWAFGTYAGDVNVGISIAVGLSFFMTIIGYYKGDAISLAASGAKRVEKRDAPELYNVVENLAIADGLPTPAVYVIDDPSPNAFATGRDPAHASVAVTTGMLSMMSRSELEGVLSHELSHVKNFDIRFMTLVVVLVGIILLLSDWLTRTFLWGGRRRSNDDVPGVLLVVGLVIALLSPLFAQLIKLAVSRRREYLADASGAMLTRHPDGLASALEKIAAMDLPLKKANHATAHLFLANPFDPHVTAKFEQLFSTHPPIEERIKRLRQMGA